MTTLESAFGRVSINLVCPWCDVATQTVSIGRYDARFAYFIATCMQKQTCGRSCMVVVEHGQTMLALKEEWPLLASGYPGTTYPSRHVSYAPEGVDANVAADFTEALRCREQGFLFASALVARRVLQVTARSIVGKQKDLYTEIEMIPLDRISKPLRDAAQEVRFIGNAAAHADNITAEEVDELLTFATAFLDHLFVLPASLARVKAARQARTP